MTANVEVDISLGRIRVIPVPATSTDVLLIQSADQLNGWSFRDAAGDFPATSEGNIVAPGAGATVVTVTGLAAGTYRVIWTVELTGAAAAADANNFALTSSAGLNVPSLNAGAAGNYPQPESESTIGASGSFTIKAVGAGTAGVTYSATISIEPVAPGNAVIELRDGNNPLAEIAVGTGGVDSEWFGRPGLEVRNQITLHVVNGIIIGAVYASYGG